MKKPAANGKAGKSARAAKCKAGDLAAFAQVSHSIGRFAERLGAELIAVPSANEYRARRRRQSACDLQKVWSI